MAIITHLIMDTFHTVLGNPTLTLILTCGILSLYTALLKIQSAFKLPPGPFGLPIFGILPLIRKEFHLTLYDYSKRYGKIMAMKMGIENVVVLSDYYLIKKAFSSRDFVARPKTELQSLLKGFGIVNSEGDLWKSNRRFLLKQRMGMKHWGGQGMAQIESVVQREVVCFLEDLLKDHNSKPVCPNNLVNSAFSNVICSMIMSTRFRYTDKKFQRFMFLFDEGFRLFTSGAGALVFLPFIKYLSGVRTTLVQLKDNRQEMLEFVQKVIAEHKETLDPEHPKDLIDSYLLEIEKIKNEEEHQELFHGFDPEKQLEQIILDLFSASVETLKTSLLWAIVYMLHNPEERRKVQQELDEKVGPNRLPRLSDMANLPYTRATLYEIMRRSSVVPMGTTHATSQEVKFEGFTIPKNTHVIPLLHAVHMDPELWDKPEEFRPSRFLVENGTGVQKPEGFMPFGVGNRMCLGDNLAEKEFFLFFSSILHTFDLELPEGAELPNLRGVAGVTVTPNKFEVVFKPRAGRTNNNVSFENGSPLRTPDSEDDPAAFYSEELMNKFNTDNALAMCQRTLSEQSSIHTRLYG